MAKKKPDPYRVLDVPKDAPKEAIRRAYRRAARDAHPDRGGDRERFELVRLCYDTLADDARRERYDRTGDLGEDRPDNAKQAMIGMLAMALDTLLASALEQGVDLTREDVVKHLKKILEQRAQGLREGRQRIDKVLRQMAALRGRFSVKDGPNVLEQITVGHHAELTRQRERLERELAVIAEAAAFLKGCRFDWDRDVTAATAGSLASWRMIFHTSAS